MTATTKAGRERRRFPRFDVEIPVFVRKKTGDVMVHTADVSRHGAFLKSDTPYPVRQLVQLRFRLPDHSEIDAMCMVARWLPDSPRGSGVGVDFFALSKEAKSSWERFIADMKVRDAAAGFETHHTATGTVALPPNVGVPMPALPQASTTTTAFSSLATQPFSILASQPPSPPRPPPPPPPEEDGIVDGGGSVMMVKLADVGAVHAFIANEIARGGMFMRTPLVKEVGEKVEIVLVHPETDDEFHLDGTVVRRVITGPVEQRGLGIFFRALGAAAHQRLVDFADSGVEVVELGQPITQRQVELEAAVAREPDSAEALEALGSYLLDEEGDLGGALTALTRALVLGPSQVSIHASLARAYRRIGDHVKVRAHERVAEALMMFQNKMKVSLGVGDA